MLYRRRHWCWQQLAAFAVILIIGVVVRVWLALTYHHVCADDVAYCTQKLLRLTLHSWYLKSFLFWRLYIRYRSCFFPLLHFPLPHFQRPRKHVVWAKSVKNGPAVRPVRRIEKKDEDTTQPICTKICVVVAVPDLIMCAEFGTDILRGYDFTGGQIFGFLIDYCMGLTTVQRYCAACDVNV